MKRFLLIAFAAILAASPAIAKPAQHSLTPSEVRQIHAFWTLEHAFVNLTNPGGIEGPPVKAHQAAQATRTRNCLVTTPAC